AETAPLLAGRTLGFEWAMIAVLRTCSIAPGTLSGMRPIKAQVFACRAHIDITLTVVGELLGTKELGTVIHIGHGNVGTDVLTFDGDQVVFRAILAITSRLPRPQLPAETGTPEQIEHGLIVHHFGGRHQDVQDDA